VSPLIYSIHQHFNEFPNTLLAILFAISKLKIKAEKETIAPSNEKLKMEIYNKIMERNNQKWIATFKECEAKYIPPDRQV
jgi:hypothetical protein